MKTFRFLREHTLHFWSHVLHCPCQLQLLRFSWLSRCGVCARIWIRFWTMNVFAAPIMETLITGITITACLAYYCNRMMISKVGLLCSSHSIQYRFPSDFFEISQHGRLESAINLHTHLANSPFNTHFISGKIEEAISSSPGCCSTSTAATTASAKNAALLPGTDPSGCINLIVKNNQYFLFMSLTNKINKWRLMNIFVVTFKSLRL